MTATVNENTGFTNLVPRIVPKAQCVIKRLIAEEHVIPTYLSEVVGAQHDLANDITLGIDNYNWQSKKHYRIGKKEKQTIV